MLKKNKVLFLVRSVLGFLSLGVLIGYFPALNDIWHEIGRPDFWGGQGPASFEWRFLSLGYWVMLAFHVAFLTAPFRKLIQRRLID